MRLFSILIFLLTFSLLSSCGRDAGRARAELTKLNYQFTADDFVRAASAGDEKAVDLFLDAGIEIDATAKNGATALMGAAENNATPILKRLIKKGAAFDKKDREGWTPMMKAIYGNKVEAVELLADQSREDLNRGLLLASLLGHTEVAQVLIKTGAEVDTTSPEGATPLGYARKLGNKNLENLLLEAGAESATSPLPEAAPSPVIASADRAGLLKDLKVMRNSPEEVWWKKYGLDLNDPKIFDLDGDSDGFSNSEEFLADTSPIDPSSHPAAAGKLTWENYHRESLPYSLDKVEEDTAVLVDNTGTAVNAKAGETVGDWTVAEVRNRKSVDKDGHPYDGSVLLVKNSAGEKIRLVPGIRPPASASYAEVKLPFSGEAQHLRAGEEFTLPDDGKRKYVVLDLREDQVVIKELTTGQTFTIAK